MPGWRRSVTAPRQFPEANASPDSASSPLARGQRDEVTAHGVIGPGVVQRGQHRGVAGGRHQLQLAGQLEHHRPVLAEEPVHQHLVIVAVEGRHLLDAGQLGGEPAGLARRRPPRGPPPAPAPGWRSPRPDQVFQHGAVGADQLLRHLPLPQPDLFQLGPGLLEGGRYPLAQHLGQVIAGPHPRGVHQARHQRQPLGLLVPGQRVDVLGSRLPGEVSDLAPARPPPATRAVLPSSSTRSRYPAWALNRDQVARWAGFFSRSNIDLPSGPAVVSSPSAAAVPPVPSGTRCPRRSRR